MAEYKRIVLKLSGEALAPLNKSSCFSEDRVNEAAGIILELTRMGIEPAVVIGGGNIWRGRFSEEMDPVNADQMGMLATVINALAVQDAIVRQGGKATVFSAQEMNRFTHLYTREAADAALREGQVALLSGGSGNPFFTTDTAAALRAAELRADALFKGTTVEGVMEHDPKDKSRPKPRLIEDLTYDFAVEKGLRVLDIAAFQLCKEQKVPVIRVFSMENLNNVLAVARGEKLGSTVHA